MGITLAAVYFITMALAAPKFPYASAVASPDEQLLYYQTAREIRQYGFLETVFFRHPSPDRVAAQGFPADTHQPLGPEISVALLTKLFGERYLLVRLSFGLIFLVGIAYYISFAKLLLARLELRGEGYTLLFLGPWMLMHNLDHPAYAAFPFFAFFPMVALESYYQGRGRRYLFLALVAVFGSSVYLTSVHFTMVLASWLLLYAFQLVRFDRKHLLSFLGLGILGLVLQWHMGNWTMVTGALDGGSRRLDPGSWVSLVAETVHETPARKSLGFLALLVLVVGVVRVGRYNPADGGYTIPRGDVAHAIRYFAAGVLWILGTIGLPLLLFPVGRYRLQGVNQFFLAIGAVGVVGYTLREILWHLPFGVAFPELSDGREFSPVAALVKKVSAEAKRFLAEPARLLRVGLWIALIVTCVSFVVRTVRAQAGTFASVNQKLMDARTYSGLREIKLEDLIAIGRQFEGRIVMTNVYPASASFFTQEAAFGGCEFEAFPPEKPADPSKCHPELNRVSRSWAGLKPTHYLLFRSPFTGFHFCQAECLHRLGDYLAERYEKVFDNGFLTAFGLEAGTDSGRPDESSERGDLPGARR